MLADERIAGHPRAISLRTVLLPLSQPRLVFGHFRIVVISSFGFLPIPNQSTVASVRFQYIPANPRFGRGTAPSIIDEPDRHS
mgnify:CR=1 FL=1